MKARMVKLEEKVNDKHNDEIQEIIKSQKSLEEIIAANSEEIKRIDTEIMMFQNDKAVADSDKKEDNKVKNTAKKCKYFNSGHCKYKLECRFTHPEETCETYLGGKKCYEKACKHRHPKVCKSWQGTEGGTRESCDYLHVTLVCDDEQAKDAHKNFPCFGCKNSFDDKSCVVQHIVKNTRIFLCLNCDGWIQKRDEIFDSGWSLYDKFGDLRRDV